MRVVSVEDGLTVAQFVEDGPEHSGVQTGAPGGRAHPDTGGIEPAGQFTLTTGHHHLICANST
jgi:hypothetical protein